MFTLSTLLLAGSLLASQAQAQAPPVGGREATHLIRPMRVDIQHSGDAKTEHFALDRIVLEPLPWAGNPDRPLDDTNRGAQRFEVRDKASGKLLYSRGYSTVFAEWRSTDEAQATQRSFQESLRFPMPDAPVIVQLFTRDAQNAFVPAWSVAVDPAALDIERESMPGAGRLVAIRNNGDPAKKVDLLLLGDGYTAGEMDKFLARARELADHLFTVSPFKEREQDFNVWALAAPVPVSGVSRPSTGIHHASSTGLRYDIFGSERYALTLDNRAFRELAAQAPYDVVEIVFNGQTYGGGGIFGQFSTVAADNDWRDYLFVHEFGHHFAGLADEYYTSPSVYAAASGARVEPWEPNVTALHDPAQLKWRARVRPGTPLPTPWPKAQFEEMERGIQARRAALRAGHRPESEMTALFREEAGKEGELFDRSPYRTAVGAFEGANYEAAGFYRPQMKCMMFDRSDAFCQVCRDAIEDIIDLYSRPAPAASR